MEHPDLTREIKTGYPYKEEKPKHICSSCKEYIYEGEDIYNIDGIIIHDDCLYDYFKKYREIAD